MSAAYSDEVKLLMQTHYHSLPEKDRRHYAAVEAIKLGYGGISYISRVLGVDRNTIIEGKKELQALAGGAAEWPPGRQRRLGGGRKKKD
ncbi:MAG: hypothetical protein M3342_14970 [Bacteroidota bacterium]|nr:hypothetical protein [Flavisolibacter sp.]MBD0352861.1 hypothetical protein [Flavisolibacter sp.]MDQ3845294.1 hypothetical protein [Bacteroidota bacterium]